MRSSYRAWASSKFCMHNACMHTHTYIHLPGLHAQACTKHCSFSGQSTSSSPPRSLHMLSILQCPYSQTQTHTHSSTFFSQYLLRSALSIVCPRAPAFHLLPCPASVILCPIACSAPNPLCTNFMHSSLLTGRNDSAGRPCLPV